MIRDFIRVDEISRQITEKPMKSERWRELEEKVKQDLREYDIDCDPARLSEYLAKVQNDESIGHKGLCFIGGVGCGKTRRARFMTEVMRIGKFFTQQEIINYYKQWGDDEYSMANFIRCTINEYDVFPEHEYDIVIDDLGTEPKTVSIYGNTTDVFVDLVIPMRYNVFMSPRHWKTHITTNLNQQQIKDRYGERCWSRLNEMCQFVPINHADRRLQK